MSSFEDYHFEEDENGNSRPQGWQKHKWLIMGVLILAGGGVAAAVLSPETPKMAPRKPMEAVVAISAPPPPPPVVQPPPPPPEQTQPEEIKQDEIVEETPTEDSPPEDVPDVAASAAGTGGPNFGLNKNSGKGLGTKKMVGSNRKSGKWDKYVLGLQSSIGSALRKNSKVNKGAATVLVRIWADQSGRVTKALVAKGSGDANWDQALEKDVLIGLQLNGPPPSDMPMPINMEIRATRPN